MEYEEQHSVNHDATRQWPTQTDSDGQRRPYSDNDEPSRTSSADDRQRPPMSSHGVARENHTLTTQAAVRLLEEMGISRTQRSVERYCEGGKLDCYLDPDLRQHLITPGSVERLAVYLKEIEARREMVGGQQATADPVAFGATGPVPSSDTERREEVTREDAKEIESIKSEIEELKLKNRDLEIATRAKDQFIQLLQDERQKESEEKQYLISRLEERAHTVGKLEAQLYALEAPKHDTRATEYDTPRRIPVAEERGFQTP